MMSTAEIILVFVLIVAIVAFLYSAVQSRRISTRYPPVGEIEQVDGVPVHILEEQHPDEMKDYRRAIVFLHGASGNLRDPYLAFSGEVRTGRRQIYLDRPGHGHSGRLGPGMHTPKAQADLVVRVLNHLKIDSAVIVGHSWGCSVAAAIGIHHPKIADGLVFIAPATHPWPGGVLWYYHLASWPVIGWLFARLIALPAGMRRLECASLHVFSPNEMPEGYPEKVGASLVLRPTSFRANAQDVALLKPALRMLAPQYPTIFAPSLILTGATDNVVWPHLHSLGLKRDIPNSRLTIYEGTGHMPHHTRKEEVVSEINAFLRQLDVANGDAVKRQPENT